MGRFPLLRSPSCNNKQTAHRAALFGACGAVLFPLAFGMLFVLSAIVLTPERAPEVNVTVAVLGLLSLFAAGFSFFGAVPGYILCRGALSKGCAGWGVAILAGCAVSIGVFAVADMLGNDMQGSVLGVGSISGTVFGGLFWVFARFSTPAAFVRK